MPLGVTKRAGATQYAYPVVGGAHGVTHLKLDISAMTTAEVDENGYLKPGVMLTDAGVLVGASPAFPRGIVVEAIKVAETNTALAGDTSDPLVAVATIGLVNRDIVKDNLGRALTADEIAGFDRAGSKLSVTTT